MFKSFSKALDDLANAFGALVGGPHSPAAAGKTFDRFGEAGRLTGDKVADAMWLIVRGVTLAIKIGTGMVEAWKKIQPVVDVLTSALGFLFVKLDIVRIAMIAFGSYLAATAIMSIGSFASAIAGASARLVLFALNLNFSSGISVAVAGFRALTVGAAGALGPVGALAAAIGSLYIAFDQFQKMRKELENGGSSSFMLQLKHDLGLMSDSEYQAKVTNQVPMDASSGAPRSPISFSRGPSSGPISPATMPATAAAGQSIAQTDNGATSKHLETIAKNTAAGGPPTNINLFVDGEHLASVQAKRAKSDGARGFSPAPVGT